MSYTITTQVNGTITVPVNAIDTGQTSLNLIGRGASGYGQAIAENTVKHLSNFAAPTSTPPANPLKGQLWYDSATTGLNVFVGSASTTGWAAIPTSTVLSSAFVTKSELYGSNTSSTAPLIITKGGTGLTSFGTNPGAILRVKSDLTGLEFIDPNVFFDQNATNLDLSTIGGKLTLTQLGASPSPGYVLTINPSGTGTVWTSPVDAGTANFLRSNADSTLSIDNNWNLGSSTAKFKNVFSTTFTGNATSASYADVAERYEIDTPAEAGDVVQLGGEKEVQLSTGEYSVDVVGVISTNPAFKMNSEAGDDSTHPYVALVGRVPVKVLGQVRKNQRLVSSHIPGVAMAVDLSATLSPFTVIGRAIADKTSDDVGLVETILGVK